MNPKRDGTMKAKGKTTKTVKVAMPAAMAAKLQAEARELGWTTGEVLQEVLSYALLQDART